MKNKKEIYKPTLYNKLTNKFEKLLNKTSNSYLITCSKLSDKGINCNNWFNERDFTNTFLNMKQYAEKTQHELDTCEPKDFSTLYIKYQSLFYNQYHNEIITISMGIDRFKNIIKFYDDPDTYCKKEEFNHYEYNFLLMLKQNKI